MAIDARLRALLGTEITQGLPQRRVVVKLMSVWMWSNSVCAQTTIIRSRTREKATLARLRSRIEGGRSADRRRIRRATRNDHDVALTAL